MGHSLIIPFAGKSPQIAASAFVAPNAVLIGDVQIGEEASVWFGAVLRADYGPILIGRGSNVQDNAVIHVPRQGGTILEEEVTIGHCAVLEGCVIRRQALIGMNAVVLPGAEVGEAALVAAGSVVSQLARIPARTLAAGVPAAVKKELDEQAVAHLQETALVYQRLRDRYLRLAAE